MPRLVKIEKLDLDYPKILRANKPFLVYQQTRIKRLKRDDPDFQVVLRFSTSPGARTARILSTSGQDTSVLYGYRILGTPRLKFIMYCLSRLSLL